MIFCYSTQVSYAVISKRLPRRISSLSIKEICSQQMEQMQRHIPESSQGFGGIRIRKHFMREKIFFTKSQNGNEGQVVCSSVVCSTLLAREPDSLVIPMSRLWSYIQYVDLQMIFPAPFWAHRTFNPWDVNDCE